MSFDSCRHVIFVWRGFGETEVFSMSLVHLQGTKLSLVVRTTEFKAEDLGFDHLARQGEGQV